MSTLAISSVETVLKKTISRCTVCRKPKPAEVVKIVRNGREQVVMRRHCPCHGTKEFVIASDARFYWVAQGSPSNSGCGCGPTCSPASSEGKEGYLGKNALDEAKFGTMEKLSTCLALIEIVDSCNLSCPACFADSPLGAREEKLKYHSFENITARIEGVLDRKGKIEILQFSGGEPTIHPEFFRLVEWVRNNPRIDYLLVNTNGVRFAKDDTFLREMENLYRKFDNIQLYFQFDGPQEQGQVELRGADLRGIREKAIRNCEKIGLPITLTMTVNEANLPYVWDTVKFGLQFEHVRGVSFQPMFLSGRVPTLYQVETPPQPLTMADIILGLHEHSKGDISLGDFTPLPCGDPNCAGIGWLFRMGGKHFSPSAFGIDIPALQASLPDRINYDIEDLKKCGCDNTRLGDLMKSFEVKESNAFRLFIKPFMDTRTWDEDRIDRCCTHVIRPDGVLDSFCRYYFGPVVESACCS
jgi:uncharacterized radical SAM superfamily Fe-S cluster-containing enzyme